jgi:hypothetical protein
MSRLSLFLKTESTMTSTPASAVLYGPEDNNDESESETKSPIVYLHQNRRLLIPQQRTTGSTLQQKSRLRQWFNTVACSVPCVDIKNAGRDCKCSCLMEAATYLDGEGVVA